MKSPTHDLQETTGWMESGTRFAFEAVDRAEGDLTAPSLLEGWTRGHVVSHLARNADALCNILDWARTGVETPMYPSREKRAEDIEAGSGRPAEEQIEDMTRASEHLFTEIASMPEPAWSGEARTAQGRPIPASEVPWMRCREVWVHAIDVDTGAGFDQIPADVSMALISDLVATVSARKGCPRVTIRSTAPAGEWRLDSESEPAGDDSRFEVEGTVAGLLEWLTGRADGTGLQANPHLPSLPRWL